MRRVVSDFQNALFSVMGVERARDDAGPWFACYGDEMVPVDREVTEDTVTLTGSFMAMHDDPYVLFIDEWGLPVMMRPIAVTSEKSFNFRFHWGITQAEA